MNLMKKLSFALALLLGLLVAACSSGESPALEIADGFNSISDKIEKATTDIQSLEIIESANDEVGSRIETVLKENADYELTDDDRAALKTAMKHFLETSMKKSMEIAGSKPEGVEETVESMMELKVNPQIDAAKTLGDLSSIK